MKKILFAATAMVLLMGCQSMGEKTVAATDLYGKFNLVQFDAAPVEATERPLNIDFEQGLEGAIKVHGVMCNTFMGEAQLTDGKLISKQGLASTRMACFREQESQMEKALGDMFTEGATVKVKGTQLTLEGSGHKFTYEKK